MNVGIVIADLFMISLCMSPCSPDYLFTPKGAGRSWGHYSCVRP